MNFTNRLTTPAIHTQSMLSSAKRPSEHYARPAWVMIIVWIFLILQFFPGIAFAKDQPEETGDPSYDGWYWVNVLDTNEDNWLFYTVQVGVFSNPLTDAELDHISPVVEEKLPTGHIRYLAGIFDNVTDAREKRREVVELGITDAFVTAYYGGRYITVSEAHEITSGSESGILELMHVSELFSGRSVLSAPDTVSVQDSLVTLLDFPSDMQAGEIVSGTILFRNDGATAVTDMVYTLTLNTGLQDVRFENLPGDALASYDPESGDVVFTGMPATLEPGEFASADTVHGIRVYYTQPESGFSEVTGAIHTGIDQEPDYESYAAIGSRTLVATVPVDEVTETEEEPIAVTEEEVKPEEPREEEKLLTEEMTEETATEELTADEVPEELPAPEGLEERPDTLRRDNLPFVIMADGEPLTQGDEIDEERLLLEKSLQGLTNVRVQYDPRDRTPVLNITAPGSVVRNQPAVFHGYTNYPGWITRYELRIFHNESSTMGTPLALISPADNSGLEFRWTAGVPEDVSIVKYVLRVYDDEGRFDETRPRQLAVVDQQRPPGDRDTDERESRIGYGENHRSVVNIPVSGAAVTVSGENLHPESKVNILGRPVPVGGNGRFAARQLLPNGHHTIDVSISDPELGRSDFTRDIYLQRREWFHLGVADFTLGMNSVNGPASLVTGNNTRRYRGESYLEGRLAFYMKGDIGAETVLTASADTREQAFSDLFTNFTARDPQSLLRRLDSNYAYPVYGDDSVMLDDAPTQGKFHVRLERHDSHLMWGSFRTPIAGSDLVHFNRGLYGAELRHLGLASTSYGERRTQVSAFAADPGTIGSREEFRATGGSLYYLRNQDVLIGSERILVEIRDRESGLVLESRTLVPFQDYELNALQGRVILRSPLSSVADDEGLVRVGAVSGNPVYLVVNYEYTPMLARVDNFTTGGRVSQWIGDYLQVGVTGYSQQGREVEQDLLGADVTFRVRPGSYVTVEHARSEGLGNTVLRSLDGGFGFEPVETSAEAGVEATAQRVELAVDFADFNENSRDGRISAYWQRRGDGFSAPGQLNTEEIRQGGAQLRVPAGNRFALTGKADIREGGRSGESRALEAGTDIGITRNIFLQSGLRHEHRETSLGGGNSPRLSETGGRTDLIGILGYQHTDSEGNHGRYRVYGLVQGTVDKDEERSSNDRYGGGAKVRVHDRITLSGEFTDGDGGWGGKAETEYNVTDRTSFYVNYLMDPDRADHGFSGRTGNLTTGGRVRYSEATSVYVERRQQTSEFGSSGLIHAFGLDLAPTDRWTWGIKLEAGSVSDPAFGDVDRRAASIFGGYTTEDFRWSGAVEYRTEEGEEIGERVSWLVRNSLGLQLSRDFRALGRANFALSDGGTGILSDAEYTELVAGLAYRPVYNNRLNALFRYTYLYDMASPDQIGAGLQHNPFAQRSHVYSTDAIVRITRRLSIGGKVGYRNGEIRDRTEEDSEWMGSRALLLIGRADIHIVDRWDLIGEYRQLTVSEAQDARSGVLLGIYRQLGSNLRLGVGYNFTDYSDDLTDMSYRSQGWFINFLGVL